jgi:uncharacterized membrane protein YhaH (DUF805 family)
MALDSERFRFLFRSDQGRIDPVTWLRGVRTLALVVIPFALGWMMLAPYTDHDITSSPFFVPQTALAYAFAILYAFVVLLVAVSYVNLSAKRFRDRGLSPALGLASLAPLAALIAGAAHWLQPRVPEAMALGWVWGVDAVLIGVVLWTAYELGLQPSKAP